MKRFFTILLLWVTMVSTAHSQFKLQKVPGLPTNEVYDLLFDKKGYLWIAHDLGITRYDGLNFTNYYNKQQASLKMTDLLEDNHGRIWFHNLSGQVFYIEKSEMKLLKAFDYSKESQYPRMALCGDELLITSNRGLFVCNTTTLRSKYILKKEPVGTGIETIAVVGSRAIMLNNNKWYLYSSLKGLKRIESDNSIFLDEGGWNSLNPEVNNDTVFLVSNPSGLVQKLQLENDRIVLKGKIITNDFVNSVSFTDKTWIHTRNHSLTTDHRFRLSNYSLTDLVNDKEGNTWVSSLKYGLMVNYNPTHWKVFHPSVDEGDFIKCVNIPGKYFFAGTQKGNLLKYADSANQIDWEHRLFDGYGSIDFIRHFKNDWFIVGASINTYLVNPVSGIVKEILPYKSIADVDFDDHTIYLAASDGFYLVPFLEDGLSYEAWLKMESSKFPFYKFSPGRQYYRISPTRSRAVRYEKSTRHLYVSFKNGLYSITEKGILPFNISDRPLHVTSLWYKTPYLFIGTLNDGVWIKKNDELKHYTTANFLVSNSILKLKATDNYLWLFEQDAVQLFDLRTNRVLNNIDLPAVDGPNVFDVAEKDNDGYLTTEKGIYKIPLTNPANKAAPTGYIDFILINNRDTVYKDNLVLKHDKNDIQFYFSSPSFNNPQDILFKYRLIGADDEWKFAKQGERMIRYASLTPGNYRFEAFALDKTGLQQVNKLAYSFTISKPWWREYWFLSLLFLLLVAFVYLVYRFRINQLLRVERVRQNIARDLHDDIGATLSSINIYTALIKKTLGDNKYVNLIQENATDVVTKLDDLVWSINPKNDSTEELLKRMELYARPMLEASYIYYEWKYDKEVLKTKLDLETKRHLYLVFKELINNLVKHSQCTGCVIAIVTDEKKISIKITDDGIKYDSGKRDHRNGIRNIHDRIESINGTVKMDSSLAHENHIDITIPI